MLTFEQVLEIFKDYLETDDEVEVLLTKRGYLRIVWPGDFSFCDDGKLCRTPEELFSDTALLNTCHLEQPMLFRAARAMGIRPLPRTMEDFERAISGKHGGQGGETT